MAMHWSSQGQDPPSEDTSPTCYNCGAYDHYLVACPEPNREIPAGLAAARALEQTTQQKQPIAASVFSQDHGGPPFKRHKPAAVVTKYPNPRTPAVVTRYLPNGMPLVQSQLPPGVQYGHGMPHFQQAPPGQLYPGHPQYPQHMSMPSQPYQAPVQGQFMQQQQQYPPPQITQQYGPIGPQQPWGSIPPQHGAPYRQMIGPTWNTPPQRVNFHQNGQLNPNFSAMHSQHHPTVHQSTTAAYPTHNTGFRQSPLPQPPQWGGPSTPSNHGSVNNFAHQSRSGPPGPFNKDHTSPPTPQSLQSFPASERAKSAASAVNLQPASRPDSAPYPDIDDDDEDDFDWELRTAFKESKTTPASAMSYPLNHVYHTEMIPPPIPGSNGLTSRFIRMASVEKFSQHISESLHWKRFKDDLIFQDLVPDNEFVPLVEVKEWILRRGIVEETTMAEAVNLPSVNDAHSHDASFTKPSHKRSRQESEAMNGSRSPCIDQIEAKKPKIEQSTASRRPSTPSFGGDEAWAPKPGEDHHPTSHEDPTEALLASLGVTGSPKPVIQHRDHVKVDDDTAPQPYRQDSGYGSTNGRQNTWLNSGRQPPPPPPPPSDKLNDDARADPSAWEAAVNGDVSHEVGSSPLSPTSAELLGMTGRTQANRSDDSSGRRVKRKQPKVAAAYSRRW